jgi:hypothetical protein
MVTLRSRINELEAENDRLSAGGGSAADASSAFGSPLKANRPAAEVVAAAAAAAARGGSGARGALGARLDASMPAAVAATLPPPPLPPPPPPAAPSGARRGLGGADIWAVGRQRVAAGAGAVNGGAVRVAAAHAAAAADDPPGLREDFLVAAHRLRWAQRALDAASVREAFGAWRRSVAQRTRQVRGAQLLLHRVLRRSKARALQAWRAALMAPPNDDDDDDDGNTAAATAAATSPEALRRLLKRAPAAVSRAFDAQAALFAAALAAAEEARGELAKAHSAELAALRQDIATQSSSLQRAMATASRLQPASPAEAAWKPPLPPPAEAQRRRQGVPPLSLPLPPLVPRPVMPRPQPPLPEPEAPRQQQPPPPPPQIRLPPMAAPPQAGFSRAAALLSHAATPPPPSPPASEAPSSAPASPLLAPRPTRAAPAPPLAFAPAALPSRPASAAGSAAVPPPSRQVASGPAVRDGAGLVQVATLVIRGWTRSDATEALNACNGRVDAAASWLLARGRMPQAAEARPQAGQPGAVTPRTPTQQL